MASGSVRNRQAAPADVMEPGFAASVPGTRRKLRGKPASLDEGPVAVASFIRGTFLQLLVPASRLERVAVRAERDHDFGDVLHSPGQAEADIARRLGIWAVQGSDAPGGARADLAARLRRADRRLRP
ncbi:hypothetical protein GCM10010448_33530 [Streptomyces glomeratus]|uniref:Uncharacterized protein n=1 Tax=Streptomyces glomeratus TaxID=284452 RepID=A0ABP6LKK3_9ACTN